MQPTQAGKLRLQAAIAAGVVVAALAVAVIVIGMNSATPPASAIMETPTKILNNGSLGGIIDILVHDGVEPIDDYGLFYCIGKLDHQVNGTETDTIPDEIKVSLQCNVDVPGLNETSDTPPNWCEQANACNPSEPGADLIPGPPPPPPYTVREPSTGYGFYYHDGADPGSLCGTTPCAIITSCFEDIGSPLGAGPNIIWTARLLNPLTANPYEGMLDIWYNQNNADCKAGTPNPPLIPNLGDLPLTSWLVYDNSLTLTGEAAPWRPGPGGTMLDFDGDGCTDLDELDKTSTAKCGDDPQNPSDSFDPDTVDLSGIYYISTRLTRGNCGVDPQDPMGPSLPCIDPEGWRPGNYIYCRADLQHDTSDNTLIMRPYCYADNTIIDINPEAYPGEKGDGFAGGPPPGPQFFSSGSYVYGDVNAAHDELAGTFDPETNELVISGCIIDPDGSTGTGHVWFNMTASAHQLPGTLTIYLLQADGCAGSPSGPSVQMELAFAKQPKGKARDDDNDGVPTARELQDDEECGLRDPFNKNDYYDVSVPRDGVIDLPNDILGVILEFTPGGYSGTGGVDHLGITNKINYDRPSVMTGGVGSWNRGSPDHVIDLPNDILGVILQFNPGGCSPSP